MSSILNLGGSTTPVERSPEGASTAAIVTGAASTSVQLTDEQRDRLHNASATSSSLTDEIAVRQALETMVLLVEQQEEYARMEQALAPVAKIVHDYFFHECDAIVAARILALYPSRELGVLLNTLALNRNVSPQFLALINQQRLYHFPDCLRCISSKTDELVILFDRLQELRTSPLQISSMPDPNVQIQDIEAAINELQPLIPFVKALKQGSLSVCKTIFDTLTPVIQQNIQKREIWQEYERALAAQGIYRELQAGKMHSALRQFLSYGKDESDDEEDTDRDYDEEQDLLLRAMKPEFAALIDAKDDLDRFTAISHTLPAQENAFLKRTPLFEFYQQAENKRKLPLVRAHLQAGRVEEAARLLTHSMGTESDSPIHLLLQESPDLWGHHFLFNQLICAQELLTALFGKKNALEDIRYLASKETAIEEAMECEQKYFQSYRDVILRLRLISSGQTLFKELIEFYKRQFPDHIADIEALQLNALYDLDPSHYKEGSEVVTIPAAPEGHSIEGLLELFTSVNFSKRDKPHYFDPMVLFAEDIADDLRRTIRIEHIDTERAPPTAAAMETLVRERLPSYLKECLVAFIAKITLPPIAAQVKNEMGRQIEEAICQERVSRNQPAYNTEELQQEAQKQIAAEVQKRVAPAFCAELAACMRKLIEFRVEPSQIIDESEVQSMLQNWIKELVAGYDASPLFYETIRNAYGHIAMRLRQIGGDPRERAITLANALIPVLRASSCCHPRVLENAIMMYRTIVIQRPVTFESTIYESLAEFRSTIFVTGLPPRTNESVLYHATAVWHLGEEFNPQGAQDLRALGRPAYLNSTLGGRFNETRDKVRFLGLYPPSEIIEKMQTTINTSERMRSECTKWCLQHVLDASWTADEITQAREYAACLLSEGLDEAAIFEKLLKGVRNQDNALICLPDNTHFQIQRANATQTLDEAIEAARKDLFVERMIWDTDGKIRLPMLLQILQKLPKPVLKKR